MKYVWECITVLVIFLYEYGNKHDERNEHDNWNLYTWVKNWLKTRHKWRIRWNTSWKQGPRKNILNTNNNQNINYIATEFWWYFIQFVVLTFYGKSSRQYDFELKLFCLFCHVHFLAGVPGLIHYVVEVVHCNKYFTYVMYSLSDFNGWKYFSTQKDLMKSTWKNVFRKAE